MANKYTYYQLRVAYQQRMLASLYTDQDDPDSFIAGYIEAVTPRYVLLWSVTPWGQPDGWLLRRTEDVLQVYMGDDYEIRLQMLLESRGEAFSPLLRPEEIEGDDLLCCLLRHTLSSGELVSLQTAEDTYTGTVTDVDDLRLSLETLDFFAAPEGLRRLTLRDVQLAAVATQEELMFQRLRDERIKLL